ncbi:TIR domain-containing protein [Clostridium sp. UBA1652]|uniref:TIR domain-containing protein n=1 Tax=Clostridium sp. UBA1652 TaxID=1946348 RepID=UPI00257DBF27|nr:TIR domain-containing protein [Clostridium sp. UBA1652]
MIDIFLSYSSYDKFNINIMDDNLSPLSSKYNIWYYDQNSKITMEEVLEKLNYTDLFILVVSNYSLNSKYVQKEIDHAIQLTKEGQIRGLYSILIDKSIDISSDDRLPNYLKEKIFSVNSSVEISKIIEWIARDY